MLNLSSLGQGCQICKTTSSKSGKNKQTNKKTSSFQTCITLQTHEWQYIFWMRIYGVSINKFCFLSIWQTPLSRMPSNLHQIHPHATTNRTKSKNTIKLNPRWRGVRMRWYSTKTIKKKMHSYMHKGHGSIISIHLFIFSDCFILAGVTVDPVHIPE